MSGPPILILEGVDAAYGSSRVLFGVGFSLAQGQTLALLGRNGAGKSTTMKAIAGVVPPSAGRVTLHGRPIHGLKPHAIARLGLAWVPEDRQVFTEHSVEDNLLIAAKKGPDGRQEWTLERIFEMFPLLVPLRRRKAGRLSGGEQQMLAIARALMGNPDVLLLDEPTEGLAPIVVQRIGQLLRALRGQGATVLLAEQNVHFCLGLATHAVVIDKGEIVWHGDMPALAQDHAVRARYLAVGAREEV
jgi:branched-chain amino acid transport system ATP-binding protein